MARKATANIAVVLATVLAACGTAAAQVVKQAPTPVPQPVRPGVPGSPKEELGIDRPPPLVREGAFVASARATLVRGASGRWYVLFDKDARGRQMPPMAVLPSQHLGAMERIAGRVKQEEQGAAGTRMLVTGQVVAYRGHNYLLPTAPPVVETIVQTPRAEKPVTEGAGATGGAEQGERAGSDAPGAEPAAGGTDAGATGTGATGGAGEKPRADEPSIEQIIGDLDRALGSRRAGNPGESTGGEHVVSEAGTARTRAAGFMTARRGRVMRSGAGESTFVVDAGTGGEVAEPPMILLPCTNLNTIETLAERLGEAATFTISGQVTVYRGRNYLLPTTYSVNRSSDQVIPNQ